MGKKILILGCHRGGTTLTASLIGRHSLVTMLNEVCDKEAISSGIGKPYIGFKIPYPTIHLTKRRSRWHGFIFHKTGGLRNFIHSVTGWHIQMWRGSYYSINDFEDMGAYIIVVTRKREDFISSCLNRTHLGEKQAKRIHDRFMDILPQIPNKCTVSMEGLTTNTEAELVRICKYIGLEYESQMLEGYKYNRYGHTRISPKN